MILNPSNSKGSTQTQGSFSETRTADDDTQDHLRDILKELKKLNLYMALAHDVVINDSEVQNG